eukprot:6467836-Amphidinium_carterae.1
MMILDLKFLLHLRFEQYVLNDRRAKDANMQCTLMTQAIILASQDTSTHAVSVICYGRHSTSDVFPHPGSKCVQCCSAQLPGDKERT